MSSIILPLWQLWKTGESMADQKIDNNETIAVELKTFIITFIVGVVTIVTAIVGGQVWFLSYVEQEVKRHADSGEHKQVAKIYARKDVTTLQLNAINDRLRNIEQALTGQSSSK
jgi:membrane peptidoglycan carboxypeptidase